LKKREYDFPPYRPPSEANSLLLRVTRGCPWNGCAFCSMYKGIKFERRPLEEVKGDIDMAAELYSDYALTVFIGDSNSVLIKTEDLAEILEYLHKKLPGIERVTSYARSKTLVKKDIEDLKKLRKAGLHRLHVGLETGDRELLKEIKKGASPEEMIEGGKKALQAGFELSLYVLLGIGGSKKWQQHAKGTAQVLNLIDPHFIRVRTFIPQPGTEIYDRIAEGVFAESTPETVLRESKALIEELEVHSQFLSDHISNYLPLDGKLPQDKEHMLKMLNDALKSLREDKSAGEQMAKKKYLRQL